ncbi:MAG: ATP-binding cassette domain-containing protein [Cardiobacteriaceae bacterium]|nr:ATP-binding cassette domain-containing protein [Cardiobacteriaceae bacterium]
MSLAEQQMVEIAKALSFDSRVIIMDEPTDTLTDRETRTLFRIIAELKAEGRGIVYISHRLPELFEVCEEITVLRDGKFIAEISSSACNEAQLIEMMVGRTLDEQYPYVMQETGAALLQVEDFSGCGLQNISFMLHSGEILGIFGLMGAGRSELAKMIYGALQPQRGKLHLNGIEIHNVSPKAALANGIAYVSEDRKAEGLVLGMSVRDNASLSSLSSFTRMGSIQRRHEQAVVQEYVDKMRIKTPSLQQAVGLLSGGNQQKVSITRGLMSKPKVLILDEPTRGVDVGAKKEIYQLINTLKMEGMGIMMISSDMPEILGISDRILVIKHGEIAGLFRRDTVSQEALLTAAIAETTV